MCQAVILMATGFICDCFVYIQLLITASYTHTCLYWLGFLYLWRVCFFTKRLLVCIPTLFSLNFSYIFSWKRWILPQAARKGTFLRSRLQNPPIRWGWFMVTLVFFLIFPVDFCFGGGSIDVVYRHIPHPGRLASIKSSYSKVRSVCF